MIKSTLISIRVDDDMLTEIDRISERSGIPRSSIIRLAISDFLYFLNQTDSESSNIWKRFFQIAEGGMTHGGETD